MGNADSHYTFKNLVNRSPYLHPYIKFCIKFRYLFFTIAAAGMWFDHILPGKCLIGLYTFIMIFLGIVFPYLWQGILQSFLVTLTRYCYDDFPVGINVFIFQWVSYFAIWFAVSVLVKNNIEKRENIIRITTAFAKTLDSRDKYTAYHSENVARYSELIAKEMGLCEKKTKEIKLGAVLHDIGKIGIPEHILNKPSKLTEDEYEIIKSHPQKGYEMLEDLKIFEKQGILDIILYHHEREDGSGYPKGLKSEEIPIQAKIVAVADSFDAMVSKRLYKNGKSFEYAVNEIISNKEKLYDSEVAEAFYRIVEREGESLIEKDEYSNLRVLSNAKIKLSI